MMRSVRFSGPVVLNFVVSHASGCGNTADECDQWLAGVAALNARKKLRSAKSARHFSAAAPAVLR
jgi:hypothetical protein